MTDLLDDNNGNQRQPTAAAAAGGGIGSNAPPTVTTTSTTTNAPNTAGTTTTDYIPMLDTNNNNNNIQQQPNAAANSAAMATSANGSSNVEHDAAKNYTQMLDNLEDSFPHRQHQQQRQPAQQNQRPDSVPSVGSFNFPDANVNNRQQHHPHSNVNSIVASLTANDILKLQELLKEYDPHNGKDLKSLAASTVVSKSWSVDSDYSAFGESTHAWAVFADNPKKRAGVLERIVGTMIILFQLFAYRLFAMEAINDFQSGQVPVLIKHSDCLDTNQELDLNGWGNNNGLELQCEAEFTNSMDAFVAYIMLGIFLSEDCLQAIRAIRNAPILSGTQLFALFAGIEVICAFFAASIAVSYNLFIGEVTDAVEVGVGLLFIRELSQKTYSAIRLHGNHQKQYYSFFICLSILLIIGMIMDPLAAYLFAGYIQ